MKKYALIVVSVVVVMISLFNIYIGLKKDGNSFASVIYSLKTLAVETASPESGSLPSGFVAGLVMRQISVKTSSTVGGSIGGSIGKKGGEISGSIDVNVNYDYIDCCIRANSATACNRTFEHPRCQTINLN